MVTRKLSSINDRGHTDRVLILTVTFGFNPLQAIVVTHTHSKDQGQSVRNIEWKQTDEQTDGGDCITSHANPVAN